LWLFQVNDDDNGDDEEEDDDNIYCSDYCRGCRLSELYSSSSLPNPHVNKKEFDLDSHNFCHQTDRLLPY
jgi:hypothetical protein